MEKLTEIEKVKDLVYQGKSQKEIAEILGKSQVFIGTCISRLRKSKNFNIHFAHGRHVNKGRLELVRFFHKFNMLHGFFPKQAWVAKLWGVSRQAINQANPNKGEEIGKFVRLSGPVYISDSFNKFIQDYAELFGFSWAEALKSFTHNVDFSKINFEDLKNSMIEKTENELDQDLK